MTILTTSLNPEYVYTQATEPTDKTIGKIWVDTSTTPPTTKVSDGTNYNALSTDLTDVEKMIAQNGLSIIDNTAQASLTAGTNANFVRDIYTISGGYLNTIDTGNTTANYSQNYSNAVLGTPENSDDVTKTGYTYSFTTTMTAINPGYISHIKFYISTGQDLHITIVQNSETILDKIGTSVTGNNDISISLSEYTKIIEAGEFTISFRNNISKVDSQSSTKTNFSYSNQTIPAQDTSTNWLTYVPVTFSNKIVQTNAQTLSFTPTKAMIIAHETTTGPSSVTYDLSTDGGTNYQTGLSSGEEITLTNTGTSLILKQNLNAGASSDEASATDWGVLFW